MTVSKKLALAGVVLAVLLGFRLRLQTRAQLAAGPRVHALTSDDYYHLRRARFAVAHFPRTILFDRLMNFPAGGVPIWPPLYDLMLAAPTRLLHGADAPRDALEREAAWVPPVLAAGTIAVAGAIGWLLLGPAGGAIAAIFLAVCPAHILWTQYGHTDQHVAESFFGTLALFLYLRCRAPARAPRAAAIREAAAGVALAAAVLAWQGAIYWGAIFAFALALEAVLRRESVLRPVVLVLGLPALLTGAATALWLGPFRPPLTYISFGFFQPLFLAALAGGTAAIDTALRAFRRQIAWKSSDALLRGIVIGAAAVVLLPFASALFFGLTRGLGYVVGTTSEVSGGTGYISYPRNWLKGIFEARPLFADGPALAWRQLSALFFLSPIAAFLWARRAVRGERPGVSVALAVWAAVTLVLAITQRLNVYYAALLCALTAAEAARAVADLSARRLSRAGAAVAGTAAAVLLALPMAPGLVAELKATRVAGSDLFTTLDWMRGSLPHSVDAYDPRLLGPQPPPGIERAFSVLAPWSLGHMLLYDAELPVVANNFGYGFVDSIRFFLAETEQEALDIARARRARWVVVTDLVPRMNDYAGYLGKPPLLEAVPDGLVPTARYFQTLQSRLYDYDGEGATIGQTVVPPLSSFKVVFRSRSVVPRGNRWVARWKVYEIAVPDAPVAAVASAASDAAPTQRPGEPSPSGAPGGGPVR